MTDRQPKPEYMERARIAILGKNGFLPLPCDPMEFGQQMEAAAWRVALALEDTATKARRAALPPPGTPLVRHFIDIDFPHPRVPTSTATEAREDADDIIGLSDDLARYIESHGSFECPDRVSYVHAAQKLARDIIARFGRGSLPASPAIEELNRAASDFVLAPLDPRADKSWEEGRRRLRRALRATGAQSSQT